MASLRKTSSCRTASRRGTGVAGLMLLASTVSIAQAGAAGSAIVVDTLAPATTATTFSVFGTGGTVISRTQEVGPEFVLTQPTVVTEIGAFMNNCGETHEFTAFCPDATAFVVDLHPARSGVPDPAVVLASFVLSDDRDPLVVSYESAHPHLRLPAGTYYAIFRPQQPQDVGFLLTSAQVPFAYTPPPIGVGFLSPGGDERPLSERQTLPAGVRVLGTPAPSSPTMKEQCKGGGYQQFLDTNGHVAFTNQGRCIASLVPGP